VIGELRDSLENLYPDSPARAAGRGLRLDVARGGTAAVHVLLNALPKSAPLKASLLSQNGRAVSADWFRLLDVPVEVNTGPGAFVEKEGEPNPYVVRRAPFRTYDAMQPVRGSVKADSDTLALRMHLPIPADSRPGRRDIVVRIRCRREQLDLPLVIHVHPPVVPPAGSSSFPYTNWFSYDIIAQRHNLTLWSEAYWHMLRRYARLMARARQNVFWIPLDKVFTFKGGRLVLNADRLRRIVKTFTGEGLHWIEGGHFGGRTTSEWTCPTFCVGLADKVIATSPEGNAAIAAMGRQLMAEIERNGWRGRWIQHIADEPIRENADSYRIFAGMVRKYMPGVPILDATMHEFLVGSVDIWCPQVQEYEKHREHFERQKALGDKVWFYTCCSPGGPWLNRLLDQELLRPALFGWNAALHGLDGFLHWGLNHYAAKQDPFRQSVVEHTDNNRLPAGDTHIVYPGRDGPWSSLRLEAQREGFEDYEFLSRLKAKSPQTARRILKLAIRRADDYVKDVAAFRAARRALLAAMQL
jgi:hypothetical protein